MRKFNLKGKVAQKLKGIEANDPESQSPATPEQGQPETAAHGQGRIRCAWRTDVGRIRKNNQDSVILGNGLYGVADGMGGHNGGEIASAGLRDGLLRETEGQEPSMELLEKAVRKVNYEIWEQQEKDATLTGMGTTLTVLWATDQEMIVGQIGDSRAYLIRDGRMQQVTSDHSMVADMVRRGVLTEEQAACHPMRNYITRAVGTDDTVDVDMLSMPRMKGDRWIICSDGLYGQMSKQELEETAKTANLEEASDRLLQLALERGGRDNISFILLEDDTELSDRSPEPLRPQRDDGKTEKSPEAGQGGTDDGETPKTAGKKAAGKAKENPAEAPTPDNADQGGEAAE